MPLVASEWRRTLCLRRLDSVELDEEMCEQLAVPLEALARFGSLVVDYRGDVAACTAFESFDTARQLAHGLLVGAWIGACAAARPWPPGGLVAGSRAALLGRLPASEQRCLEYL